MIMEMLMKLFDFVGGLLMKFVQLPIFPPELSEALTIVYEWMGAGMGIINFFCPLSSIAPAIACFIAIYAVQKIYYLVMWVVTKIPFLGISNGA